MENSAAKLISLELKEKSSSLIDLLGQLANEVGSMQDENESIFELCLKTSLLETSLDGMENKIDHVRDSTKRLENNANNQLNLLKTFQKTSDIIEISRNKS
ncbi:hypothetical protein BB559_006616 [Furculomyces boomerangus]|uniref:Uncharacterized protein n=1 Tax=Furculomyces boomerangus TaxID=61424 RepID=A0A2T9Y1I5_9FUNG|nr:hypothetical protein BB559_006616 [Furculomyces boomerangus]